MAFKWLLLLALPLQSAARPVVAFESVAGTPYQVRRTLAVPLRVSFRDDAAATTTVCLSDTCGFAPSCQDVSKAASARAEAHRRSRAPSPPRS